jgi:hypothetical protein
MRFQLTLILVVVFLQHVSSDPISQRVATASVACVKARTARAASFKPRSQRARRWGVRVRRALWLRCMP